MIKSIYTAASGMVVQQKRQENVANNLANAQTPSFKAQEIIASANGQNDILKDVEGVGSLIGSLPTGTEISGIKTDYAQGLIESSDRQLDYAIDGAGFFNIEYKGQRAFSRNGSFNLDREGYLINSQGHYVLGQNAKTGENEKILINHDDFTIKTDGTVVDGGSNTYTLMISDFLDYDDLENLGDGVYLNNPADGLNREVMADEFSLVPAAQELSNVNVLDEMVKMIEISRAYESNQPVVQSIDNTQTDGYKAVDVKFESLLSNEINNNGVPLSDDLKNGTARIGVGTKTLQSYRSEEQGALVAVEDPFSLAIQGEGYFGVLNDAGDMLLTRSGKFFLSESGQLVDDQGNRLEIDYSKKYDELSSLAEIGDKGKIYERNEDGSRYEV